MQTKFCSFCIVAKPSILSHSSKCFITSTYKISRMSLSSDVKATCVMFMKTNSFLIKNVFFRGGSTVGTDFYICKAFIKIMSQIRNIICLCCVYVKILFRFVSIIRKNKQYYINRWFYLSLYPLYNTNYTYNEINGNVDI